MPQLSSKLRKKLVPFGIFHQLQTCGQVWGWYYINDEWQLCNKCLQTQYLPQDHTGANLAEAMEAALAMWDLDAANQICVTMDNGSNIVTAARILDWLRHPCFGHNLHLAVTKAVQHDSRCSRVLGVSRKVVSSFFMSWKRKRELTKAQINPNIKQHSLVAVSRKYLKTKVCL